MLCCLTNIIIFISSFIQMDSERMEEKKNARFEKMFDVMQQMQHQVAMQGAPQDIRDEYFRNIAAIVTKKTALEMKKAELEELKLNLEIKKLTNILGGDDVGEDVEGKEGGIVVSVYIIICIYYMFILLMIIIYVL